MPTQSTSWAGIAVLEASTKSEGNRYCVNKYYRRERDVDVNINPPTRIHMIDRVIFTIKVPVQRQRAIDIPQPLVRARPPAYCRLVVARTYVQQPRIAVIAVAPCPRKAIGVAAAAPLRYRVADRRRLAAACANFLCGVRAYTCTE